MLSEQKTCACRPGQMTDVFLFAMGLPVKSISFREDVDGSICLHKKIKTGMYKSASDSGFSVLYMVKFEGLLTNVSGYVFQVNKSLGEQQISKQVYTL